MWMSLYVVYVWLNKLMVHLAQLLIAVNNIRVQPIITQAVPNVNNRLLVHIIICFTDGKTEFRPCLQVRFLARYSILTGYCLALCQWISDRMGRHPLCLLFSPSPLTQCSIILLSNGLKNVTCKQSFMCGRSSTRNVSRTERKKTVAATNVANKSSVQICDVTFMFSKPKVHG